MNFARAIATALIGVAAGYGAARAPVGDFLVKMEASSPDGTQMTEVVSFSTTP